jgi:hypothetical protein
VIATNHRGAGYLIVQDSVTLIDNYNRTAFAVENGGVLGDHRRALSLIHPTQYRGVARAPADAQTLANISAAAHGTIPPGSVGEDDVIDTLALASYLLNLVPTRTLSEVIYVETGRFSETHKTLGFDAGYWGGDHFSLIADVAITPRWHPPPPDAFALIAERLKPLNDYMLFPTANEAASFVQFYRAQDWAETEFQEGEFAIIRVALP